MTKDSLPAGPYVAALRQFAEDLPTYLDHDQIAELWVSGDVNQSGEARWTTKKAIEKVIEEAVINNRLIPE